MEARQYAGRAVVVVELPLVVGVDGSCSSLRAVDWAMDTAVVHGVSLRLVHAFLWQRYEAVEPAGAPGRHSARAVAENILEAAARHARRRAQEVEISTLALPEDPVRALLNEGRNASMVVLGSRGRSRLAGLLLGSVSLAVAARADCPVVVLHDEGDEGNDASGTRPRVVLGVGRPDTGPQAVRFAFREAEARRWALYAVRAWRRPAQDNADRSPPAGETVRHHREKAAEVLEDALAESQRDHPRVEVRPQVTEGLAGQVLLDASRGAGLLVVGARRAHGYAGLQLGRVAHTALHHAGCPVAVVPQRG
ncbi:universal stress protein [Streptomyces milbemycinicus]|uniref:Universal stress protein n=1 Tax=Streptomyces milbemycinicus TaxID=476552 RepID=A0ABW8LK36_9ACTN